MRTRLWLLVLILSLSVLSARAQETRGNIPTSTNFGLVTGINATTMRFVNFVTKVSF